MKSHFKLGVAFCVIALAICASAGSIETFNYSTSLNGVSSTTVNAKFSYNTATGAFTSESLAFVGNSIFGGLGGTVTQQQYGNTFVFNETVSGYTISYTIVLDPTTGSYHASGSISENGTTGTFLYARAPEGGTQISYLAASGLVLLAGMFLAGKSRRRFAGN